MNERQRLSDQLGAPETKEATVDPPECSDLPDLPEPPVLPADDGPFVEVSPGTWVRAGAVIAVEAYADRAWHELRGAGHAVHRRAHLANVIVGGGNDDPGCWRSPYPPAQLREALRLAEHGERLRSLEGVARLVLLAARRRGDGR